MFVCVCVCVCVCDYIILNLCQFGFVYTLEGNIKYLTIVVHF